MQRTEAARTMRTRPYFPLRAARGALLTIVATVALSASMIGAPLPSAASTAGGTVTSAAKAPASLASSLSAATPSRYPGCSAQTDFSDVVGQGPLCQSGRQFVVRLRNTHDVTVAPPDTI